MYLFKKIRGVVRRGLKAWGPRSVVRKVWEKEFAEGGWDFIEFTEGDCVYPWIEKYAAQGSILDLGCGSGNTGNELRFDSYRSYIGVDLSEIAVQKAISRSVHSGRNDKNCYLQGDICTYEPVGKFDVILYRECIWHVPRSRLKEVLDRSRRHLTSSGVMIFRIYDRFKFEDTIQFLLDNCEFVEKYAPDEIKDIVLVLR